MKFWTKYQKTFAILFLILTILLNIGITVLLNLKEFSYVWLLVPLYAIPVFLAGWILGKKDNAYLPLALTGFKFHLITYIIANGVVLLKHYLGMASIFENINTTYYTILFWGFGVLLHFILLHVFKGETIKGISKEEIF